jgi:hypothetical protein
VVVVEDQVRIRRVGEVGGDVGGPDFHLPVLHVLGMHEQDVLDQPELLEQHRADQAVEVTPGNQPISLHRHLLTGRQTPCRRSWSASNSEGLTADGVQRAGRAGLDPCDLDSNSKHSSRRTTAAGPVPPPAWLRRVPLASTRIDSGQRAELEALERLVLAV